MNSYSVARSLIVIALLLTLPSRGQTWRWAIGSKCPNGYLDSWPIAVDGHGNIYEAGFVGISPGAYTCHFGSDSVVVSNQSCLLVSADSDGNYRWVIGATGSATIWHLTTDNNNNIYAFGNFFSSNLTLGSHTISSSDTSGFCAKINSSGTVLWLKKICDKSSIRSGGTDGLGNLYAVGSFSGTSTTIGTSTIANASLPGGSDILVVKLDTLGNAMWGKRFGGSYSETAYAIAVNHKGESYIGGNYNSTGFTIGSTAFTFPPGIEPRCGFVAKLDSSGGVEWADQITARSYNELNSLAIDGSENVYVTGVYKQNMIFGTDSLPSTSDYLMYLASYDFAGNIRWAQTINNNMYYTASSVVADVCGNIWVSGMKSFTGTDAMYIVKYDTTGILMDSLALRSGGDDWNNIVVDNRGNLYVGADYYIDSFVVGADTLWLEDNTGEALFIAKYSYPICTLSQTLEVPSTPSTDQCIYPNPADHLITIQGWQGADFTITSLTGSTVLHQNLHSCTESLDIGFLSSGLYIACLNDLSGGRRKIIKLVKE